MSNGGRPCCLLGVCCAAVERRGEFVKELVHDLDHTEAQAAAVADWILEHFDLAPKGTLQPLVDAIADLARATKKP